MRSLAEIPEPEFSDALEIANENGRVTAMAVHYSSSRSLSVTLDEPARSLIPLLCAREWAICAPRMATWCSRARGRAVVHWDVFWFQCMSSECPEHLYPYSRKGFTGVVLWVVLWRVLSVFS
jgi:hypothetical protein